MKLKKGYQENREQIDDERDCKAQEDDEVEVGKDKNKYNNIIFFCLDDLKVTSHGIYILKWNIQNEM